jgi:hypothetical protein
MTQVKIAPRTIHFLAGAAVVVAVLATGQRTSAQYPYQCPVGYYYLAGYGCAPLDYYYGPPDYIYPGFGFFYGGSWGRGRGSYGGGGFHGGGGGHGGGHR